MHIEDIEVETIIVMLCDSGVSLGVSVVPVPCATTTN